MIKIEKKNFIRAIVITVIITLAIAFGGFFLIGKISGMQLLMGEDAKEYSDMKDRFTKINYIWNRLDEEYLYDIDDQEIKEKLAKSLLGSLGDEYSEYYTAKEFDANENMLNGSFSGIGIIVQQGNDGRIEIIGVYGESPAENAGLQEGDIITKVDGKAYENYSEAASSIRGDAGTDVKITYERDGKESTVSITRAKLKGKTVSSRILEGNIGYIRLNSFGLETGDEFKTELNYMESKKVKGFVIDLRNNGGGYVDSAIEIADQLLPECNVTSYVDRDGNKTYFNSDTSCTDLKYVVWVNQNTASASEILASAIKDNNGGKIIGKTTYGKGVVQINYRFKDGSGFKFTSNKYVTPKGNDINDKGVSPDVTVKSNNLEEYLAATRKILK